MPRSLSPFLLHDAVAAVGRLQVLSVSNWRKASAWERELDAQASASPGDGRKTHRPLTPQYSGLTQPRPRPTVKAHGLTQSPEHRRPRTDPDCATTGQNGRGPRTSPGLVHRA